MSVVRKTKSVKTLMSIFEASGSALSVVDLVEQLKVQMNKTTVYRILERLEGEGTIHSFIGSNGLKWYAKCSTCTKHEHDDVHPHFECRDCGKVECLEIEVTIPKLKNRLIESADVLLTGQCADCLN
ncbi:Fur family transcriptional regulator [Psychroserpens sp.]|uniref:Fur family transcriptional regulator n=1 Tax=Psychroserpens sp. TaxID=2020870 RepID=UPI001B1E0EBE|nr:transcriptional repressor [Psychroserpens sp.]MBO6607337.1 transcriptional repressor [Psychroserpens sp.]MBO6630807.1 transcriptional repressor [Psychroserpens sp.]MBO6654587.1 transcriptional repressor [Psychroserpens sp.]MBO6681066.1 transcriptional repressor [Psychroserpens sp.]MBO6749979.1 transcriptional repressor [Psychroserpens sp.]